MTRGLPVSVLLHLLILGALVTWGGYTPMQPIDPQHVLRVQLASLPETLTEPEPAAVAPPPAPAEPEPEVAQPEVVPPPAEPDPVLPPKEVPEQAPDPSPEPPLEPEPRPQPPVAEPKPEPAVPAEVDLPEPAAEPLVTGPAVSGTDQAFPFDYYLRTVRNNIARKWQPKQLGFRGQSERSCVVHFAIARSGLVSQVTLVRSSGVSLFDREALRAVKSGAHAAVAGEVRQPEPGRDLHLHPAVGSLSPCCPPSAAPSSS